MIFGGFHGASLAQNSTRCNPFLALGVLFGGIMCLVGTLSPLYGDAIYIPFIYMKFLKFQVSIEPLVWSFPFPPVILFSQHSPDSILLF